MGFSAEPLVPIYRQLGNSIVGVEVGVCKGQNIYWLLKSCLSIIKIYGIDPWMAYKDKLTITQETADQWYETTKSLLQSYVDDGFVELLRMPSAMGALQIEDEALDFVFIDGNHSYDAVVTDLAIWLPKVRPGGIFSGHDFRPQDHEVRRAVYDFADKHKIAIMEAGSIWKGSFRPTCWYYKKGA